jgi:SSS family solute:Na+ symporter
LWSYLQSVLSYATPPIVATFLGGIFWSRANRHGAFLTLLLGITGGVLGFIFIEIMELVRLHFLYAAGLSLVFSVFVLVVVSLLSEVPPAEKTDELTWRTEMWHAETEELMELPAWQNYRYQAGALFLTTAAIVIWFW